MSIPRYRASEPLYMVIVRDQNAETLLKNWARDSKAQVVVENNRMKVYDDQSLSVFQITWTHASIPVLIWDCWNKRHINWQ